MSKYEVFCGPYFPVFSRNIGKYGPEKTSYLDTFQAVYMKTYILASATKNREDIHPLQFKEKLKKKTMLQELMHFNANAEFISVQ